LEELEGVYNCTTVYAIVATLVLQKTYPKLIANGGKITRYIHQNELLPKPNHWKKLENHMFGVAFKADYVLELSNLKARKY
jgi:hypothetical protein